MKQIVTINMTIVMKLNSYQTIHQLKIRVMVFNATFNNISVRWLRSVLLVEEMTL